MEHEPHEAALIFPEMNKKAFEELVADIKEYGLKEPIVLCKGEILDGRHRYKACLEADVKPRFTEWHGNGQAELEYVISKNLTRRHLTAPQRGMIAARIANLRRGRPTTIPSNDGFKNDNENKPLVTQQEAADMTGVGVATVTRASKVLKEGTPEQIAAVESGEASLEGTAGNLPSHPTRGRGNKMIVPEGYTIESYVTELIDTAVEPKDLTKDYTITKLTYEKVRPLVLLTRMQIPEGEASVVRAVLNEINETRQIKAYKRAAPIVARVWGKRARTKKGAEQHTTTFQGMLHIIDNCSLLAEMPIPVLETTFISNTIKQTKKAEQHLKTFRGRLEELL